MQSWAALCREQLRTSSNNYGRSDGCCRGNTCRFDHLYIRTGSRLRVLLLSSWPDDSSEKKCNRSNTVPTIWRHNVHDWSANGTTAVQADNEGSSASRDKRSAEKNLLTRPRSAIVPNIRSDYAVLSNGSSVSIRVVSGCTSSMLRLNIPRSDHVQRCLFL
jgi:hypothetical protein